MMYASVVFPRPGGPYRRTWSRTSFLCLAASIKMERLALIFSCPTYSTSLLGRKELSYPFSPLRLTGLMRGFFDSILRHPVFQRVRLPPIELAQNQPARIFRVFLSSTSRVRRSGDSLMILSITSLALELL